jgi:hypothetical protein
VGDDDGEREFPFSGNAERDFKGISKMLQLIKKR